MIERQKYLNEFHDYEMRLEPHKGIWYPISNPSNSGEHGILLENLIGIQANNSKLSDLELCEIKTSKIRSTSMVTLFTQSFNQSPKFAEVHVPELGRFNATVGSSRFTNSRVNPVNLKLSLGKERLFLHVKDKATNSLLSTNDFFWERDILDERIDKKIKGLIITNYAQKEENGKKFVMYTKSNLLLLDTGRFFSMLDENKIKVDIRMGVKRSGPNIGKKHDHGTAFRVSHSNLRKMSYSAE